MQPSQTRQERRAAERKARKLARKATQPFQASPVPVPAPDVTQSPVAGPRANHGFSPELESEFSIESLNRARSLYDHFEAKAVARRSASHQEHEPQQASSPVLDRPEDTKPSPQIVEPVASPQKSKSTGPRTPTGKLASSGNSLKHGLAAPRFIIPGENRAEFDALLAGLIEEHQPASPTEELLVHEIAQSWWLTQRALRFQNECFTAEGVDQKRLSLFLRYQTTHERAFHKALTTLIRLKKDRARGFVSQSAAKAQLKPQFVSQNAGVAAAGDQFVSQNEVPEKQFEAIAA
ncbi:MAG: hypothetical protein ACR2JB_12790 [Bryobacteraceae bacterium]